MLFTVGIDARAKKQTTRKATVTGQVKTKKMSSSVVSVGNEKHEWVDLELPSGTLGNNKRGIQQPRGIWIFFRMGRN